LAAGAVLLSGVSEASAWTHSNNCTAPNLASPEYASTPEAPGRSAYCGIK